MSQKEETEIEITHENHRRRIEERFLKTGFLGWSEYEILEYLLFAVYKRRDTADIAHILIMKFGSLRNVLAADKRMLTSVKGVGNEAARYLTSLREFMKYINVYSMKVPSTFKPESDETITYIKNLFFEEKVECFYMICLDNKNALIKTEKLSAGTLHSTNVEMSSITQSAAGCGAAKVIFAHNHPVGGCKASDEDIRVTAWLANSMFICGVEMLEHMIVSEEGVTFIWKEMQQAQDEKMNDAEAKVYKPKSK